MADASTSQTDSSSTKGKDAFNSFRFCLFVRLDCYMSFYLAVLPPQSGQTRVEMEKYWLTVRWFWACSWSGERYRSDSDSRQGWRKTCQTSEFPPLNWFSWLSKMIFAPKMIIPFLSCLSGLVLVSLYKFMIIIKTVSSLIFTAGVRVWQWVEKKKRKEIQKKQNWDFKAEPTLERLDSVLSMQIYTMPESWWMHQIRITFLETLI